MLTNSAKEVLSYAYKTFSATESRDIFLVTDDEEIGLEEVARIRNAVDLLESYCYIEDVSLASGFVTFKITPDGISLVECGFIEDDSPILQTGDTYYIESGNVYQNCYNNISIDINQSELPDDIKNTLVALIKDFHDATLTKSDKNRKLKQFLSDITSDALSSSAANALTVLLSSLFSQIPF